MSETKKSAPHNQTLQNVFFMAAVAGASMLVAVSPDLAQGATPEAVAGAVAGAVLLGGGYYGVGLSGKPADTPEPGQK